MGRTYTLQLPKELIDKTNELFNLDPLSEDYERRSKELESRIDTLSRPRYTNAELESQFMDRELRRRSIIMLIFGLIASIPLLIIMFLR
jgi:hypothetical protein